jgi:predicted short-subunit dehydrogenase-like oxidoreductase (DUF2520 family)
MIRSVNIIGAGNVANWLGNQFKGVVEISSVYSRDIEKAKRLAKQLSANPIDDLSLIDESAELTILAVADSGIPEVAMSLSSEMPIVHTSGFTSMLPLERFQKHGVFYPLQTISINRIADLKDVPMLIEASSDEFGKELKLLADRISPSVNFMDSSERKIAHLAAVFANNFSNHMLMIADEILQSTGKDLRIFKALLRETIDKALEIGPKSAQTGPAKRRDESTIKAHLSMLKDERKAELYKLISKSIQDK